MNKSSALSLSLAVLFVGALGGCQQDKAGSGLETGAELYLHYCASCHKEDGTGRFLQGIPTLVQNKLLKPKPLEAWQIKHKIKGEASKDRKMPTFDHLTDAQAALIAEYINGLTPTQ